MSYHKASRQQFSKQQQYGGVVYWSKISFTGKIILFLLKIDTFFYTGDNARFAINKYIHPSTLRQSVAQGLSNCENQLTLYAWNGWML